MYGSLSASKTKGSLLFSSLYNKQIWTREYWKIYSKEYHNFLRSSDSAPRPPPFPSPISKLSLFLKSYDDREKAWPSINHSILSGIAYGPGWESCSQGYLVVPVTYMPPPSPPPPRHTHVTCTIAEITWLSLFTRCHDITYLMYPCQMYVNNRVRAIESNILVNFCLNWVSKLAQKSRTWELPKVCVVFKLWLFLRFRLFC